MMAPSLSSSSFAHSPSPSEAETSPSKRKARHARTNASLTSSSSVSSLHAVNSYNPSFSSPFHSLGFDPMRTDPDQLFTSLSVKQVETYENVVRQAAAQKQAELRTLVGERYQDLLGTANTIIDMANSSTQLLQRLDALQHGISTLATSENPIDVKKSRRISSFTIARAIQNTDSKSSTPPDDEQDDLYTLGASLKMIVDSPEYVWRSIEKGKTLHAAWAFMLTRATWWDLLERSPDKPKSSTDQPPDRPLKLNVKATFPFIEKQWQGLVPMRKQIVHRAVHLLADLDIDFLGTLDQLAAIVLLDNSKIQHAFAMLLSQRLTALRNCLKVKLPEQSRTSQVSKRRTSITFQDKVKPDGDANIQPAQTSFKLDHSIQSAIKQFIRGYCNTLQQSARAFLLPDPNLTSVSEAESESLHSPCLVENLRRMTQVPKPSDFQDTAVILSPRIRSLSMAGDHQTVSSPSASPSSAARLARGRRSSTLVFNSNLAVPALQGSVPPTNRTEYQRPRISTEDIIHALPSSNVLIRFLPMSVLAFSPYIEIEPLDSEKVEALFDSIKQWSGKLTSQLVLDQHETSKEGGKAASAGSISSLLGKMSTIGALTRLRAETTNTLDRCVKATFKKIRAGRDESDPNMIRCVDFLAHEFQLLQQAFNKVYQDRLEVLYQLALSECKVLVLAKTDEVLAMLKQQTDDQHTQGRDLAPLLIAEVNPLQALFSSTDSLPSASEGNGSLLFGAAKSMSAHSVRLSQNHLNLLNRQLQGRTPLLDGIVDAFESNLSSLDKSVKSFLFQIGTGEQSGDPTRQAYLGSVVTFLNDLYSGLAERLCGAEVAQRDKILALNAAEAVIARLSASIGDSQAIYDVFGKLASDQPSDEPLDVEKRLQLWSRAQGLVKQALQGWKKSVLSTCLAGLSLNNHDSSSDGVSKPLLSVLWTISEATLRAGVALRGSELNQVTSEIIRDLSEAGREKGQMSSAEEKILDRLDQCIKQGDEQGMDSEMETKLQKLRLVVTPLLGRHAEVVNIPIGQQQGSSQAKKIQPISQLARPKVGRFELLPTP